MKNIKIKYINYKILQFLLSTTMLFTMTACGKEEEDKDINDYWNNEVSVEDGYEDDNSSYEVSSDENALIDEETYPCTYLTVDGANSVTIDEGDGLYTDISYYKTDENNRSKIPDTDYCVTIDGKYTYSVDCNYDSNIFIGQDGVNTNLEVTNQLDVNNLTDILSSKGYSINSIEINCTNPQLIEDKIISYEDNINTGEYDVYHANRITLYKESVYGENIDIESPLEKENYTNDIVINDNNIKIKSTRTYENTSDVLNEISSNINAYYGIDSFNDEYNNILENGKVKEVVTKHIDVDNNIYISYSYYVNDELILCFGKDEAGNEMYNDLYGIINNNTDSNNVQFTIE